MATRAQVLTMSGQVTRKMLLAYNDTHPEITKAFVRTLVGEVTKRGTPVQRRIALALLRELYVDLFGSDPLGKRDFRKWIQSSLNPTPTTELGRKTQPYPNITLDDAFDAANESVT